MIDVNDVKCPKCGGPVWDERPNKKNPKGPDFRCKDKTCLDEKGYKTSIWERDLIKGGAASGAGSANGSTPRGAAPASASTKQAYSAGGPIPGVDDEHPELPHEKLDRMFGVYDVCLDHAHKVASKTFGNDVTDTAVAAMTATLFIAAKDALR